MKGNAVNEHTLSLMPIYFDLINSGEKVLEGRLNDEKRKNFNIGDKITFYKLPEKSETLNAIILNKYIFDKFEDMANKLDKKDLGFQKHTKDEMISTYRTIYLREDEQKFGVAVFKIKVIK